MFVIFMKLFSMFSLTLISSLSVSYLLLRNYAVIKHIAKKQKAYKKLLFELDRLNAQGVNTIEIRYALKNLI